MVMMMINALAISWSLRWCAISMRAVNFYCRCMHAVEGEISCTLRSTDEELRCTAAKPTAANDAQHTLLIINCYCAINASFFRFLHVYDSKNFKCSLASSFSCTACALWRWRTVCTCACADMRMRMCLWYIYDTFEFVKFLLKKRINLVVTVTVSLVWDTV